MLILLPCLIGHDTTASAISWILFSLAENPEYQIECQEEIDRVISETKDGDLGWYDTIKIFSLTDLSPSCKNGKFYLLYAIPMPCLLSSLQLI